MSQAQCTGMAVDHISAPTSLHVIPSHAVSASVAEIHSLYSTKVAKHEEIWRDRYAFLLSQGLELRVRYRPGWTPSWIGTSLDPLTCEDSVRKSVSFRAPIGCSLLTLLAVSFIGFWMLKDRKTASWFVSNNVWNGKQTKERMR
jgi:hypothetical protein